MPANYVLLEKITVGAAGASSVTFNSIPQTGYTDLVLKVSVRTNYADLNDAVYVYPNGSGSNGTRRALYGTGSAAGSDNAANIRLDYLSGNTTTSNTFGSGELYIPNYTSSNFKSMSMEAVAESNTSAMFMAMSAGLWSSTSAITSLQLTPLNGSFMQYSTFYLYGVAKLGTTPAIVPYATGGDTIMTDGTYWYHAFKSSGTFTPAKALTCDVLRISGGGGGGYNLAGGGGGGGIVLSSGQSLLSGTAYTATIGAGGTGSTSAGVIGGTGSQTTFTGTGLSLSTVFGGGGGQGDYGAAFASPSTVASGGGADGASAVSIGGTTTTGQGNTGGYNGSVAYNAGGGGGAGAVGGDGSNSVAGVGGNGGAGINTYSSWATPTGTGVSGFFGGGGGGSGMRTSTGTGASGGTGGSGGGGTGGFDNGTSGSNFALATVGVANTGGGGGGGAWDQYSGHAVGANGGSGLVIVRYAV